MSVLNMLFIYFYLCFYLYAIVYNCICNLLTKRSIQALVPSTKFSIASGVKGKNMVKKKKGIKPTGLNTP